MTSVNILAIDLAKRSFQVCGTDRGGAVLFNRLLSRGTIRNFVYGRAVEHFCLRPRGLETVREENGKLGFRHCPFSGGHFPLFLRSVQDQIQEFRCCLI